MGNSDEGKATTKSEKKSTSTLVVNSNVHVYPDWATMQAYYGSGVALQPYYNSAVAPGHPPPPYMWGPQHMMPPYGTPYAAIYPQGGVYAHPAIPIASTPLSIDTPLKSSANTDKGLMKKLKGFDGLTMSIGNDNANKAEGEAQNGLSQSLDDPEGSSDGSDGSTNQAGHKKRKRSLEGTPTAEVGNAKPEVKACSPASRHISASIEKVLGVPVTLANANGSLAGASVHAMGAAMELKNQEVPVKGNQVAGAPTVLMSSEAWLQNERELKRERRKQSNRESARRSRLRKQAETEELAIKVESLSAENLSLKSEINQLTEGSEKLRSENSLLMEKLKSTEHGLPEGVTFTCIDAGYKVDIISTENLLSKVDESGSLKEMTEEGIEAYERGSKSGAKFHHQLLDSNRRADAVAAG